MVKRLVLLITVLMMLSQSPAWCQGSIDSGEAILARAKHSLLQKFPLENRQCELKELNSFSTSLIAVKKPEYLFTSSGKYWVNLEIRKDGKLVRTLVLRFKVVKHVEAICAMRAIRGKDLISLSDLVREQRVVDVGSPVEKHLVTDPASFEGKRARYYIAEGTIITTEKLEPNPPVRKLEDTRVLIQRDDFAIESVGKALEDSFCGSRAKVRLQNGRVLQGIVNDLGQVEIKL
jgi:flagella basal body P-ring formation protein FlgA